MAVKSKKIQKIKKHVTRHAKKISNHAKDHFIPHSGNNHHPHVLKHHVLFGYTAILLLLKIITISAAVTFPKIAINAIAITPANILSLTNQARAALNISALTFNGKLTASAQAKALDMLKNQYFDHTSPDGITPWYWIKSSGYSYKKSAENLAVHYTTAENVQDSWMASPSHKKNILNPVFTESGVGIAHGIFEGVETTFVVQHFGQPAEEFVIPEHPEILTTTQSNTTTSIKQIEKTNETVPASDYDLKVSDPLIKEEEKSLTTDVNNKPTIIKIKIPEQIPELPTDHKNNPAPLPISNSQLTSNTPNSTSTNKSENNTENSIESNEATSSVLGAIDQEGSPPTLIWVGPDAMPQYVFGLASANIPQEKLFGLFNSDDIKNIARGVYTFLLIFLTFALLLSVFIKFHIQNIKAISHTLGVIGLIVFFLLT